MAVVDIEPSRSVGRGASRGTTRAAGRDADDATLDAVARRILWLAVRMVHEANHVRPNEGGIKVGGHQASSASVVSILTAMYFRWLRADDLVAIKPHASPAYHAIQYLLGNLDRSMLLRLRDFGGLQSYPSRTKDPDPVDFSTGSVGLGAVAPMFASLADRYLRAHFHDTVAKQPDRRFVALVGDAELDEGNVWEALLEEGLGDLGNVTMIVDLNRQSLDRVVPGIRIRRLEGMFAAAGWNAIEAKYGRALETQFAKPDGDALRERIDDMENEEYQILIRRPGPEARTRLIDGAPRKRRDALSRSVVDVPDEALPELLADLGGHDQHALAEAMHASDAERARPTVIFAYTIKGWRLPFAGDSLNHSALLGADQVDGLMGPLGADPDDIWAGFAPETPAYRLSARRRVDLGYDQPKTPIAPTTAPTLTPPDVRIAAITSTQQAFGDTLAALARDAEVGPRLVTAAPDVAVSTNLGGWINRAGVFAPADGPDRGDVKRPLAWNLGPSGRHIELGISEMNLFMWLSQFGLTGELFRERLVPIGTVYDPFIARGLDALIYALYIQARFILVGTPSGVTLSPEGGAHQSTVTPSLGIELPGLRAYEPVFGREVVWTMLEGLRGCLDPDDGFATYLRLATRPIDQSLAATVEARLGLDGWRDAVLAGGYRLLDASDAVEPLPPQSPVVQIMAAGSVIPEAIEAVRILHHEEIAANLIVLTSAERLARAQHVGRLDSMRRARRDQVGFLGTLLPRGQRHAPIVTVADAASHSLSFVGGVFGAPVVPLGVDTFGQSGTIPALYQSSGIDAAHIVEGAILALDLAERPTTLAATMATQEERA